MGAACTTEGAGGLSLSQKEKVEFLKKTPFFLYLDNSQLNEFADCCTKVSRYPVLG